MSTTTPATREEWAAHTEEARRAARFTFTMRRARKIIEGEPHLTPDQLRALAEIFRAASDGEQAAAS